MRNHEHTPPPGPIWYGTLVVFDQIHVCKATTLPGVLSAFWELTADHAHERYQALKDDTEYNAHLLFVAPRCSVLKDYGMMRHLVREGYVMVHLDVGNRHSRLSST